MWSTEVNSDELLQSFRTTLEKENPSKGSFQVNYEEFCSQFQIVPCPFITALNSKTANDAETCRITNGTIDLSSWRAMLLAIAVAGSKVEEIYVHNSRLTSMHLSDLATTLDKNACKIVKIQMSEIADHEQVSIADSLKHMLSGNSNVVCLSLKGCLLGDDALSTSLVGLESNFRLQSLNLSNNHLTDNAVVELLKSIRLNCSLRSIDLSNNIMHGGFLEILKAMLLGMESTAEDDSFYKNANKTVADRNKAVKELNKKRKKAGFEELPEIVAPNFMDLIVKRDEKNWLVNKFHTLLDFSSCHELDADLLRNFVQGLVELVPDMQLDVEEPFEKDEEDSKRVKLVMEDCDFDSETEHMLRRCRGSLLRFVV